MSAAEANGKAALPKVVVVVLTWNDTEMTAECLASALANDYANFEVLLVDNGSKAPCGEMLREKFPQIEVLTLPENCGFAGGSNRGLQRAFAMGADYVHLVGNDAVLGTDVISKLVAALEAHPHCGAASPLLFDFGEDRVVQFYTAALDRDVAVHAHHWDHTPYATRTWPTVESDFIPFVAMMFRTKALRQVGLLDETFGTCWEDFDLVVRLADGQWKLLMVGEAEAVHRGSATTGRSSPYLSYFSTRNRLVCLKRYADKRQLLRRSPYLIRTFWWQVKENGITSLRCHLAMLKGIIHFMLGVRGERGAPRRRTNQKPAVKEA